MSGVVFIPTRNRLHNIEKVVPKWQAQDMDGIILVTEPSEKSMYKEFLSDKGWRNSVDVISPTMPNIGIGATRKFVVKKADKMGLHALIMSDDDAAPVPDTDIDMLIKDLKRTPTIGIGACFSFYGLMLGNALLKAGRHEGEGLPYLVPGGMGYITFSLSIKRALEAGNYDAKLHTFWEDAELVRDGMKNLGYAWHVHTGAWCTSIGKRFMPGGLSDFAGKTRSEDEKICHRRVFKKWGPRYISHPDKKAICRWQNFLNDFVEGWRDRAVWAK